MPQDKEKRDKPSVKEKVALKISIIERIGIIIAIMAVFLLSFALIFFFIKTKDSKTTKEKVPQIVTKQSIVKVHASQIDFGEKSGPDGQVYSTISIPETDLTIQEEGFPQLPVIKKIIEISSQVEKVEIEVSQKGVTTTPIDRMVYPVPKKVVQQTSEGFEYIEDDFFLNESIYQNDTFVPVQSAAIVKDDYFRSKRTLELHIYPVRYNPKQEIVESTSTVEIKLTYHINPSLPKPKDTTRYFKGLNKKDLSDKITDLSPTVSTPAPWVIQTAKAAGSVTYFLGNQLIDPNNAVDYLIITHSDFFNSDELNSFATYRANYDSFLVGVVSIEDIIAQFPNASGNDYSMQDFITYAYHNWQTSPSFLLLVGDSEWVPTHSVEWALGIYDNDDFFTYGADEDANFEMDYANLAVGRFPVGTVAQIAIIKNKIEYYEQGEIISGDYHQNTAYMKGWDVGGLGVTDVLSDKGFDLTALHGPCPDEYCINDVCSAFHSNFVTFTAHGSTSNVGLSNCCDPTHNLAWSFGHCENPQPPDCYWPDDLDDCGCCAVDTTSQWNAGAVPIVMVNSCYTAQIRDGVSIAEVLVTRENKGAVAYFGASSLAESVNATVKFTINEIFDNFNYYLGQALLFAEFEGLIDHHQQNLLGDPALHAFGHRVNNTQPELTIGSNDFSFNSVTDTLTVTVTNLGGAPASDVFVEVLLYETDGTVHPFTSLTIPAVSAYSEATANVQAAPPLRGEYKVVVKIDPNNANEESFELNNQTAKQIDTRISTVVTVLDELGQPLSNIYIRAYDSNDVYLGMATTDNNGQAFLSLDSGLQVYFDAVIYNVNSRSTLFTDFVLTPTSVTIQKPQPSHLTVVYPDEVIGFTVLVYDIDDRNLCVGFNASETYEFFIKEGTQFYYQIVNIMDVYFNLLPDIFSDIQIAPANTTMNIEVPNQPPIADAGTDQIVDIDETVIFNGSGSSDLDGSIVGYAWDFGDNNTGSGVTTTHSYAAANTYTVTLTVTDNEGATGIDTCIITVNEFNNPPVLDLIGNKTADEGFLLEFTVTASDPDGDPLTYSATNLPVGATFSNQVFSWTPSSTQVGDHQVTFTVEDDRGGSDSETITITVQQVGPVCGDGYCAGSADGEDCTTCSQDCISGQGGSCSACWKGVCDGSCNPKKETSECADCAQSCCCGDGICEGVENVSNCQIDCGCSDDAACNDDQPCTTDICDEGVCQNTWPSCGTSDGCCGPTCSYLTDPDCQNCDACFKGICDGSCHPKKEGLDCPDCQV